MYLDDFGYYVVRSGEEYKVHYFNGSYSGVCTYDRVKKVGKMKPIRQEFYIMTECEMGRVIEYVNKKGGLSSEDLTKFQSEIREDSLSKVKSFTK